ncbi:MAG: class I SAM-dependent methyltransferase [Gemmataceae bacterium]|nr:class I SAM-dependent methyltransferase [Gemmataceae bacterium]
MATAHDRPATPSPGGAGGSPFDPVWTAYRQAVDNNYFSHLEVGRELHRELSEVGRPFRFLDLACGDARTTAAALRGTAVAHYRGVDLSATALAAAREAVADLPCPAELEEADFAAGVLARRWPADVVWIGLSLHHLRTDEKGALMEGVRAAVGDDGRFLVYEPVCGEGEDRPAYFDRFEQTYHPLWPKLTAEEWTAVMTHIRAADYPESPAGWARLGRAAGFAGVRELFTDPAGMVTMFSFLP